MGGKSSSLASTFIFPAPPPSYDTKLQGICWIDEDFGSFYSFPIDVQKEKCLVDALFRDPKRDKYLFPALLFLSESKSDFTILYWHGNSCDLGNLYDELRILNLYLNCNICAIEYPGYGLKNDLKTSSKIIEKWGKAAFDFLVWLGISPQSILLFGRSIGTGPASKLAAELTQSNTKVGGLILHAPYLSIHRIAEDYVPFSSWIIENYWDNESSISKLYKKCPILIIHGMADEIINVEHGKHLFSAYSSDLMDGSFPLDSTHNDYYIIDDIGQPIRDFLQKLRSISTPVKKNIIVPSIFFEPPSYLLKTNLPLSVKLEDESSSLVDLINSGKLACADDLSKMPFDKIIESPMLMNSTVCEIVTNAIKSLDLEKADN